MPAECMDPGSMWAVALVASRTQPDFVGARTALGQEKPDASALPKPSLAQHQAGPPSPTLKGWRFTVLRRVGHRGGFLHGDCGRSCLRGVRHRACIGPDQGRRSRTLGAPHPPLPCQARRRPGLSTPAATTSRLTASQRKGRSSLQEPALQADQAILASPPADWVRSGKARREDAAWRSFRGPPGRDSQRHEFMVLGSLCSAMHDKGYLRASARRTLDAPWDFWSQALTFAAP